MDGHAAFGKAAGQPKHPGRAQEIGGGVVVADAALKAPVLRTGTKDPQKMVSASPKRQPSRYQGELVGAMKQGKVDSNSTLRVFKTPSGRFLNAGGTHRHLARQAMGQPTNKVEVKSLGFEPRQSILERARHRGHVAQLTRASRKAVAGKPMKPVGSKARSMNAVLAEAHDFNDDMVWRSVGSHGIGTMAADGAKAAHHLRLKGAAVNATLGAGLIGAGALKHRAAQKQKVGKAMDGHEGFEISKAYRRTAGNKAQWGAGVGTAVVGGGVTGAGLGHALTSNGRRGKLLTLGGAATTVGGLGLAARAGGKNQERYDAQVSKRNRDTSFGRDVTGAVFPGIHGAIAGKPGHKLKAVGYEMGGQLLLPTVGAGVGTHIASQKGHYQKLPKKKVSKRDFSTKQREKLASKGDALPDGSFPIKTKGDLKNAEKLEGKSKHPAEVAAFIERKKAELSKAATGHEVFLEDVEKAFGLGGAMDAAKGVGAIGRGILKPKVAGVGQLVAKNPVKAAGIAGGAGLGAGYMAGKH